MYPSAALDSATDDQCLLGDAKLARALLELSEFTNAEELRYRAILKTQVVVEAMNRALSAESRGRRTLLETTRDELQAKLDRTLVRQSGGTL